MQYRSTFLILLMAFVMVQVQAQTCCSGGVPISSNLGMPLEEPHILQMNLSYDVNILNTLKTGREVIKDRNRKRATHSLIAEASYGLSKRFSMDMLVSYVRQERTVNNFSKREYTSTDGFGDATLLMKYLIVNKSTHELSAGLGIKFATGSSMEVNNNGITLNADLQPGSGATDVLFWSHLSKQWSARPSSSLFVTLILVNKGHNKEYLSVQDYKFGDEWQVMAGVGDRMLILGQIADLGLAFRYRQAAPDQNNHVKLPSTGGQWLFVSPSVAWWLSDKFSWSANVELPLYANITGTQVSPSLRFNTGFYYKFPLKKNIKT